MIKNYFYIFQNIRQTKDPIVLNSLSYGYVIMVNFTPLQPTKCSPVQTKVWHTNINGQVNNCLPVFTRVN